MFQQAIYYLVYFFQYTILLYSMMVIGSYIIMGFVSAWEVYKYRKGIENTDFRVLLKSPFAPSISIIAPAYNESATIVDNVRSLVSLHYGKLTVIVVNDGSKDDTLQKAIDAYDLEQVNFAYNEQVHTKPVRGVYKSKNPAFKKLIVVDKENGGKADAINVGVNVADTALFACIDVDCVIEPDAFLKMAKPFMEAHDEKIIAAGGIVWLTNESEIQDGKLIKLEVPKSYVPRIQVIEYIRAFLLGRTAWSKVNGLLLISGAFGLFDREIAIAAGGYKHDTVGEDMELVMRMHSHMRKLDVKYKIAWIPEPLCWTEAPGDYNILGRQRNRWTRGTIECLMIHKEMCFNPRFGILGWLSYPYWFLAEWLAPFVEAGGLFFFIIMAIFGLANWSFFFLLTFCLYAFALWLSMFSVLVQQVNYNSYNGFKGVMRLLFAAFTEPFIHHPRVVYWALKGNYDFFTGKNTGWGEMVRQGFSKEKK